MTFVVNSYKPTIPILKILIFYGKIIDRKHASEP